MGAMEKDVKSESMSPAEEDHEMIDELERQSGTSCGILGRYPVLSVLIFAVVGMGVGIGLSFWKPEDPNTKDVTLKWLGLIGDLFLRSLKAIVLPLVFVNVVISVMDMMAVGKAGTIGVKTIFLYLFTTLCAAIAGVLGTVMFRGLYTSAVDATIPPEPYVKLACDASQTSFLTEMEDKTIVCDAAAGTSNENSQVFMMQDLTGYFMKTSSGPAEISLSDTIYSGIFTKLITDNIVKAFYDTNFAGVVVFAIAFGVALAMVLTRMNKRAGTSSLVCFLEELDAVLIVMIMWVIACTPFAVASLIIKAIGSQDDLKATFSSIGFLVAATLTSMVLQFIFCYLGVFMAITKKNPFPYLKKLIPALLTGFATSSSAATIPVTQQCVISTGRVPPTIAKFVVPLGATVNMDGSAIYFPCACIWLAYLNGITPGPADYILLVIIATIGSVGTAPVPSASLVLIITAYNTVFNTTGTPFGFSYILAIDWFMDRCRTVQNITGDAVVTGIVSHLAGDVEDEHVMNGVELEMGKSSANKLET